MPQSQPLTSVANTQFTAAFELWETRYRSEPEGFLTSEETAAMEVATVSEGRSIYFGALLRETTPQPLTIGTHYPAHGGTLGAILCRPDGQVYGLIVSAAEHEIVAGAWGEYGQDVPGAKGIDGAANTRAMAAAHSPIATSVQALAIDGHTDWYIPSRIESVALFEGVRDLFDHDDWYWTSSQSSRHNAFIQGFEYGFSISHGKDYEYRVRPVRMIQLGPFTPSPLVAEGDSARFFAPGEQQAVAEAVA